MTKKIMILIVVAALLSTPILSPQAAGQGTNVSERSRTNAFENPAALVVPAVLVLIVALVGIIVFRKKYC